MSAISQTMARGCSGGRQLAPEELSENEKAMPRHRMKSLAEACWVHDQPLLTAPQQLGPLSVTPGWEMPPAPLLRNRGCAHLPGSGDRPAREYQRFHWDFCCPGPVLLRDRCARGPDLLGPPGNSCPCGMWHGAIGTLRRSFSRPRFRISPDNKNFRGCVQGWWGQRRGWTGPGSQSVEHSCRSDTAPSSQLWTWAPALVAHTTCFSFHTGEQWKSSGQDCARLALSLAGAVPGKSGAAPQGVRCVRSRGAEALRVGTGGPGSGNRGRKQQARDARR